MTNLWNVIYQSYVSQVYCKKYYCALAHDFFLFCLSLFWPPKSQFWSKNLQFSNIYVNQILNGNATMYRGPFFLFGKFFTAIVVKSTRQETAKIKLCAITETLILYLFFPWKPPPKAGYFIKAAEIFSTALICQ